MLVNSAYDQHTWLYADQLCNSSRVPERQPGPSAGDFLPWRLALSRGLYLPRRTRGSRSRRSRWAGCAAA